MSHGGDQWRDRSEIRRLVEAYALAVDQRDAAWFGSLWLPSATLTVYDGETRSTGSYAGAERMGRVITALRTYLRTVHLVSTHRSEIAEDGATATGQTYCVAHHLRPPADEGEPSCEDQVMTIRYHDRYRRDHDQDGAWRFEARACHKLWVRTEWVTAHLEAASPVGDV